MLSFGLLCRIILSSTQYRSSLLQHNCILCYLSHQFESLFPAERRSHSYQLEFLFNYYIRMLQRHQKQSGLMKVWESVSQGLQLYPYSPELLKGVVEVGHFHTTSNKLRRILDERCYK